MPNTTCVVGLQWGDEGKGKIVDLLSEQADVVVRYQGGANAGHTLVVNSQKLVLHLVPSGIVHRSTRCIIAHGVVLDPVQFGEEIEMLRGLSIVCEGRLVVSERTHVVLSFHKLLDTSSEKREHGKLGTTGRGIGPCYADKAARLGVRVGDLFDPPALQRTLERSLEQKNAMLTGCYGERPVSIPAVLEECERHAKVLKPFVGDHLPGLLDAVEGGKRVLLEGAQGTMLDIDLGTYPYVTSSNTCATGASSGSGIPPRLIANVVGVSKAYTTRVGEGPFPTEQKNAVGESLRELGKEFGATTGRPRRCGWLDLCALKYAARVNGVTSLAITKLDVLDAMKTIAVATHYELDGARIDSFPTSSAVLARCRPVYREFPGWQMATHGARKLSVIPAKARAYLEFIRESVGVPISILSSGPGREDVIDTNG
ncbi:MAG: adenylosuccinate synthase [Planctomycetota bacterium]|nr:adenylosuccinate synthase [Planctomycetota bacterium]